MFDNKNYWSHELKKINENIPKRRISIKDLIDSKNPSYETKEGIVNVSKEELDDFLSYFSNEMYDKIRIPVMLLQQSDYYRTSGSKYDQWIVERLMGLDKDLMSFIISISDYNPKYSYYYAYQVNKLRRKFPTLIQIVYSMG